jgi:hypothetical protein
MSDRARRANRHVPVRPNLEQLKRQAKELLRGLRRGDADAISEFKQYHPDEIAVEDAKLADAQTALARGYSVASWPRLVQACQLIDAIWRDEPEAVRALVIKHPNLVHEPARGGKTCSWGPPMSYAANLGRDRILLLLHDLGATDHSYALGRATLQSKIATARKLQAMMGNPRPPADALGNPAYTLSALGHGGAVRIRREGPGREWKTPRASGCGTGDR